MTTELLHPILGTDKKNACFSVYSKEKERDVHVYFGLALLERVNKEPDKDKLDLKIHLKPEEMRYNMETIMFQKIGRKTGTKTNKSHNSLPFTLLELLAVIAIIALLAAMLLPALKKAKDKAKDIECMGNLKQLGYAFLLYAGDYADNLPPYSTPGLQYWFSSDPSEGFLMPYLPNLVKGKHIGAITATERCVLSCPRVPTQKPIGSNLYLFTYGYNNVISLNANAHFRKLSQFKKTSDTSFAMDIAGTVSGAYAASTTKTWVDDGVADKSPVIYRHSLQANVVFADGHTESRRWGSIPDDDLPGWTNCRTNSFFWSPLSPAY
ncbi:MAG: hypothetical protein A2020_15655 [Lentisphaerae bacterium GWF2_45_14]|nr:MAG: hypothetical protein A2020_15655 [Lentisphaerae bacterium GWF2_45_14]